MVRSLVRSYVYIRSYTSYLILYTFVLGPYASVKDVYNIKGLSAADIGTIKKYENKLTATPATGLDTLRGRDPYRRSFNK